MNFVELLHPVVIALCMALFTWAYNKWLKEKDEAKGIEVTQKQWGFLKDVVDTIFMAVEQKVGFRKKQGETNLTYERIQAMAKEMGEDTFKRLGIEKFFPLFNMLIESSVFRSKIQGLMDKLNDAPEAKPDKLPETVRTEKPDPPETTGTAGGGEVASGLDALKLEE